MPLLAHKRTSAFEMTEEKGEMGMGKKKTGQPMTGKKHYEEIDICRGMGIVLVVLGHALKQTGETNSFFDVLLSVIYSFHMPLFFFLSGFVSLKMLYFRAGKERLDYIKNRAFRLLIPYFTVGILYLPLKYVLSRYAVKPYDFSSTWKLFFGENPNTALWFLYVLFLVSLVCVLILREKNVLYVLAGSFALTVAACCFGWPWKLPKYAFFFVLGIFVRLHYENWFQKVKWNRIWVAAAVFAAANAALYLTDLEVLWDVTALAGIVMCLQFGKWIAERKGKAEEFFAFLGAYSMDIYILSEPLNTAAKLLFWSFLKWNYLICTLLCFLISLGLPIPVSKHIVRKVKALRIGILGVN